MIVLKTLGVFLVMALLFGLGIGVLFIIGTLQSSPTGQIILGAVIGLIFLFIAFKIAKET